MSRFNPTPRPASTIGDDVALVKLTQGHFAVIDAEDATRVDQHFWHTYRFRARMDPLARNRKAGYLHEFLVPRPEGGRARFRDGNSLNCRKANIYYVDANGEEVS